MKKLILSLTLIFCFALCAVLASCGGGGGETPATVPATEAKTDPATGAATVPATEAETNPATDVATVPTTDAATDPVTEPACDHVWDGGTVTKEAGCIVATKEEIKGEITYVCTLCGATKTEEIPGHTWDDGKVVSAATCSAKGMRLYTCTVCKQKIQETIPIDPDAHTYVSGDKGRIVTPPTETADGRSEKVCTTCGTSVFTPVTYADYSASVTEIKAKVDAFNTSDFGSGSVATNLGGSYAATPVKPTAGQHPRVLFNGNDIAGIERELHDKRSSVAFKEYRAAIQSPTDGKLLNQSQNFSAVTLNKIQLLALDYALTGNEISGYNAINAIKNALLTMNYEGISDVTRPYGYTMYIAACVYDWCYDLLSGTDKTQIILGVQKKICEAGMEVGFPPSGQTAISGHGSEYGLLRDYLSFAIAIYDEYPGWWDMIGGRYYSEFVPIREAFYEAGMAPQGVSLYLQTRYACDLYSAWLIYGMSGTIPFDSANMKQVARSIFSHELPGTYGSKYYVGFNTGDDHTPDGSFINYGRVALISSHLFDDATMRAELEYYKYSYTDFSTETFAFASVGEYLICSSHNLAAAKDRHEGMDLILYNGGWLGQTIARNNWGDRQAAVLMKVGVKTTANHDHLDCGQFQIYYREILAGDTGAYAKYGEDHHYYYHQATIAHNSLLIYDTSLAGNTATYKGYYSGGQKFLKSGDISAANYNEWLNGTKYVTGTVTGHEEGYADDEKTTATYAYIAGNIAAAYPSTAVSEVTRRMLTVFDTGNDDVPMYFIVFDNITAKDASFKKTFLLHTATEPTVEENTVTEIVGNGKLVLQNVVGNNVTITKRGGGEGQNYLVNNGSVDNYVQLNNSANRYDDYWGRIEISPAAGSKTDQLVNVMYVCDADKDPALTATAISSNTVKGAVIGNTAAAFIVSATRRDTKITFNAPGSGTLNYYVSGMAAGTWTVLAGGKTQTVTVTEESGLLVFTGAAGSVTLTPQN